MRHSNPYEGTQKGVADFNCPPSTVGKLSAPAPSGGPDNGSDNGSRASRFHHVVLAACALSGVVLTGLSILFGYAVLGFLPAMMTGFAVARLTSALRVLTNTTVPMAEGGAHISDTEQLHDQIWELRDTLQHYRALVDQSGEVVLERDADDRVIYMNPSAQRLLASNPHIAVGHILDLDGLTENDTKISINGEGDIDLQLMTVNGPCWFSWRDITIRDEADHVTSTLTLAQDISNRKAHETALTDAKIAAEDANSAKSRFLATVSHEIRTPLNGILGMTGLLIDTELSPEQRNYAEIAKSSGMALLDLINDLLDISRVEAGRLDLLTAPTDIRKLIEELAELFAPKAHAKGLELAVSVDAGLPDSVVLDESRLRQVLLNLIGNAVKFTEAGGVRLRVTGESGSDETTLSVRFIVDDTGPGIAIQPVEAVFDEFRQADDGPTRVHGGSGLGLSISQRIVTLMGGHIAVETGSKGSRFSFSLSVPGRMEADKMTDPLILRRSATIIWDSVFEAAALQEELEAFGYQVSHMTSCKDYVASGLQSDLLLYADMGEDSPDEIAQLLGERTDERDGPADERGVILAHDSRGRLQSWQAVGFETFLIRPIRASSVARLSPVHDDSSARETVRQDAVSPDDDSSRDSSAIGLRVLVVEDNDVNALLVTKLLEKMGHVSTWVADGEAGILAARETAYDLILMDLHMPRVDGRAALVRIRADEQAAGRPSVPIVALTADVLAEQDESQSYLKFDDFITKPINPNRLDALLTSMQQNTASE